MRAAGKWLMLLALSMVFGAAAERVLDDPVTGKPVRYAGRFSDAPVRVPDRYRPQSREMRGVWVATVENIDFAPHADAASFKRDYIRMVENLRRANFNTILFQVRPMNDAFYPSKLAPWSRWMTGAEGRPLDGSFDPLAFMVAEAHRQGLEFHAWLNPYRVAAKTPMSREGYLETLDPKNFARRNPDLVLAAPVGKGRELSLFLDPGNPRVVRFVRDVVREIAANYPVDGIVFDDYFYPYSGTGNIDDATFRKFNPKKLSVAEWRRENVNSVIRGVKEELSAVNRASGRKVVFGVSPFGIWGNKRDLPSGSLTGGKQSFLAQYADSRTWVRQGWVDYISPQLYWPFGHEVAAYAALADWWSDAVEGTGVNLYISQGTYRLGSEKAWRSREIVDQLLYNQKRPEIRGSIFFSYRNIFAPSNPVMKEGVERVLRDCWRVPALAPACRNAK